MATTTRGTGGDLPTMPDPGRSPEGGEHLPTMPDPANEPERGQRLPTDPDPVPKPPSRIGDPPGDEGKDEKRA